MNTPLLEVKNLKKYYPVKSGFLRRTIGYIKAVDGVDFFLNQGETLGLVGESGCGKSTAGKTILRLIAATEGSVFFQGRDLLSIKGEELRKARRAFQMIFQDPYASLNPRMTIGRILEEPLKTHGEPRDLIKDKVAALLEDVGLSPDVMKKYPFEFSGGQRQRIGIARALALSPALIVADEPVSALDVSIQAQVINLMANLRSKHNLTYLFISHDLSVVYHISDRVAVMYLGRIVELADKNDLFGNPEHPYTRALLSAVPIPDVTCKPRERILLTGDVPSPLNPPPGCSFHPRCGRATDVCSLSVPILREHGAGHWVACHL